MAVSLTHRKDDGGVEAAMGIAGIMLRASGSNPHHVIYPVIPP